MTEQPEILVIGESLVDIVAVAGTVTEHPGGSPANVALGLGRRGRSVALLTRLGRDPRASTIVRHLERSGVEVLADSFTDQPTSTARATLSDDGSAAYEFDIRWDLPANPPALKPHVVHTGSLAAFLEPGASTLIEHLHHFREAIVTFDPNIRRDLMPEHGQAVKKFERIAHRATVVKLSDEDARWLYPSRAPADIIADVQQHGPRLVALTLGAAGALLGADGHQVVVPAAVGSVSDTIGAGDTFMTSLIDDYSQAPTRHFTEEGLHRLGTRAAAAAAVTVSRPGADLPWTDELIG